MRSKAKVGERTYTQRPLDITLHCSANRLACTLSYDRTHFDQAVYQSSLKCEGTLNVTQQEAKKPSLQAKR